HLTTPLLPLSFPRPTHLHPRVPHSFPTRRSSDLYARRRDSLLGNDAFDDKGGEFVRGSLRGKDTGQGEVLGDQPIEGEMEQCDGPAVPRHLGLLVEGDVVLDVFRYPPREVLAQSRASGRLQP